MISILSYGRTTIHVFNEMSGTLQHIALDSTDSKPIEKIMSLIKEEQPELSDAESYEIAKTNIQFGDTFECIDPVLLTAIQKVESDFNPKTRGTKGELGINQILPTTGKELCSKLGWKYNERVLHDINSSTYLACVYLDHLYQRFGSMEAVLVGYNCGPTNALRFSRNNLEKIPPRGFDYVTQVLNTYLDYQDKINNT
jgi:hypothetical protein